MWRTIGLGDWLFNMDMEADKKKVAPAVLALAKDPAAARAKAEKARAVVERYQRDTMAVLARQLG
jgi:GH24 family phage-related lysozyme (muramidase)